MPPKRKAANSSSNAPEPNKRARHGDPDKDNGRGFDSDVLFMTRRLEYSNIWMSPEREIPADREARKAASFRSRPDNDGYITMNPSRYTYYEHFLARLHRGSLPYPEQMARTLNKFRGKLPKKVAELLEGPDGLPDAFITRRWESSNRANPDLDRPPSYFVTEFQDWVLEVINVYNRKSADWVELVNSGSVENATRQQIQECLANLLSNQGHRIKPIMPMGDKADLAVIQKLSESPVDQGSEQGERGVDRYRLGDHGRQGGNSRQAKVEGEAEWEAQASDSNRRKQRVEIDLTLSSDDEEDVRPLRVTIEELRISQDSLPGGSQAQAQDNHQYQTGNESQTASQFQTANQSPTENQSQAGLQARYSNQAQNQTAQPLADDLEHFSAYVALMYKKHYGN
ncbi:hypothetical protein HYALB_00006195 [Hymenoscyphus albidus]|uniref:Uncharacterized protein n=1 Tax=Hymenoscyphus albidus TaxID=595503 RepID=A0A9N9LKS8_9HELO|nr:hypothetical protein HYALB_00006195 [Hymenoscyphus albidus]